MVGSGEEEMSFLKILRQIFKPTPEEKAEKLRKRIVNMYGHTEDRRYALSQLRNLGEEYAPRRLIERFTCKCENGTVDAEEKAYTSDLLVDLGEASVEPLKLFLKNNDKDFSWPYRTLARLIPHESLVLFLVELLDEIGPEYVRDPERKEQLMLTVKSFDEDSIAHAVLPYLSDDNETIRFVTADTVIAHAREDGISALSHRLCEEESQRILTLIAAAFRDRGWKVEPEDIERARERVASEFRINDKGVVL